MASLHIDRSGILSFEGVPDLVALNQACAGAFASGLGRIEVHLPADPELWRLRRVFHQAGFSREGVRRGEQVAVYSLLVTDTDDPAMRFTSVMNSVTPRKRLIAHTLLLDAAGRVALCETSFKPDWELPGGIVEPGESPLDGCRREVVEELGIDVVLDRVLVLDWLKPYLGWDDALEVIYGAPPLSAEQVEAVRADGREILAVHWLDLDAALARVAPFAVGRLRAAWAAAHDGRTRYLEGGTEQF